MLVIKNKSRFSGALAFLALGAYAHSQQLDLSDLPLTAQGKSAPANVVVTIDDSGSMGRAYIPDDAGDSSSDREATRYRSAAFNKAYYDPEVTYLPPKDYEGNELSNASFTAATRGFYNRDADDIYTVNLSTSYRALRRHEYTNDPDYVDSSGEPAYYNRFDTSQTDCDGTVSDNDCYSKVVITNASNYSSGSSIYTPGRSMTDEQQNFANWYQYYATRVDAAKTSLSRAFVPDNVSSEVRIGRQALNTFQAVQSGPPGSSRDSIAALTDAEREDFYDWIKQIPTSGYTPLRAATQRAGEYFKTDNAYDVDPVNDSGELAGCRVNSHILVTDGFYNRSFVSPTDTFLLDQSSASLPDGESYSPSADPIYSNSLDSESLADLAFHYWATDLRPGAGKGNDNNVPPFAQKSDANVDPDDYWDPRNDPATWQHMNSYGIAYGAEGKVDTSAATLNAILDGSISFSWPETVENAETTIDDLYHASINGRGAFFNTSTPDEFAEALNSIIDRISQDTGRAPRVGATSGRISNGTNVFIASYETNSWSGDLEAYAISDGSEIGSGNSGDCNANPVGTLCDKLWSTAEENEESESHLSVSNRQVFSYDPTASDPETGGRGIDFSWASLNPAQQLLLSAGDSLGEKRVAYLLGDSTGEVANGGAFRNREANANGILTRAAPVMHSLPTYVGVAGDELAFRFPDDLESNGAEGVPNPYEIQGRHPLVFVGGNNGMLHAYDALSGREVWSYVPNEVIESLPELTDPNFTSGAFVDGRLDVQDAFVDGSWKTLLAGGLRSGGQGYFLLDVTKSADPTSSSASASDHVRWEFSDDDDVDMGYSYAQPVIVRSNYNGGEWVVLLPNGYNSTEADGNPGTGEAFLYVLAADDGSVIAKIGVGVGSSSSPNGLSTAVAVSDYDVGHFNTQSLGTDPDAWTVDYAYAGDLQGNMWKFDLSATDPSLWQAYLLMETESGQPITAQPAVGAFPATNDQTGNEEIRFVYFGTGQFVERDDISDTNVQTYYTVLDDDSCTNTSSACVSKADLVTQTISSTGIASNNTLDVLTNKGCRIDLDQGSTSEGTTAERVINQPLIVGQTALFNTIQPTNDICSGGAQGAIYAVNRFTCGATTVQILDYNNDSEITEADMLNGSVRSRKITSINTPTLFQGPDGDPTLIDPDGNEQLQSDDRRGRVRWRQIK